MNILAPHIMEIFNNVIQQGFPRDWKTSLAIPLFKSGDINNPSNYRTIMINLFLAKNFSGMVENRISKWVEVKEKREKGQASFRLKHSTVDHGLTLRDVVEKVWGSKEEVFFFSVDLKKEFDTVPRDNLWHRMEEIEIPLQYRDVVHRLYEEVKVKIRTSASISESFRSNIGVKQGFHLSPWVTM